MYAQPFYEISYAQSWKFVITVCEIKIFKRVLEMLHSDSYFAKCYYQFLMKKHGIL